MKKGFLESSGEALYPPEGSHQGEVSDEVKAEWMRRAANDNINDMTKGKVRPEESTDSGPALPPPPWYHHTLETRRKKTQGFPSAGNVVGRDRGRGSRKEAFISEYAWCHVLFS